MQLTAEQIKEMEDSFAADLAELKQELKPSSAEHQNFEVSENINDPNSKGAKTYEEVLEELIDVLNDALGMTKDGKEIVVFNSLKTFAEKIVKRLNQEEKQTWLEKL